MRLKTIFTKSELKALAEKLGVRDDWHEPDEQEVTARTFGESFDNSGFWGLDNIDMTNQEMFVVLYQNRRAVAQINLATLFAFACDTDKGED